MVEKNLLLDIDTILNKEFPIDFKGYPPQEVDQFLDSVIRDYDTYEGVISELSEKVAFYEEQNEALKAKVVSLESKLKEAQDKVESLPTIPQGSTGNLSQVDILRRIARLEQEIYTKK